MPKISVPNCGAVGVIRDLSAAELPLQAWTDARNIRFLDSEVFQFLGHGEVYNSPSYAPQHVMPITISGARYWLYMTAAKQFVVTNTGGAAVHTDISHVTPRTGVVNRWTSTMFSGIPVVNAGDTLTVPMYWDQNLTHKFLDLPAWPANTYCKVIRSFKSLLVAANITKGSAAYPYMVKWSTEAVPGSLPSTWNESDATQDAGEFDLAEGQDAIVDALGLKDSLIVYKEASTWAIDYIGGVFILRPRRIFGMSGLLNKNCAVDVDSFHFAVTGSDIITHDGYNAASILDKKARRDFFHSIDISAKDKVFCFLNPFLNEIFVCYPSIGSSVCDRALVYNFIDKTVTYRTMPNVNHAAFGPVDNTLGGSYDADNDPVDSDLTAYNGPDFVPDTVKVLLASSDVKLYMLDASASFNGAWPNAYLEKRGISLTAPEFFKTCTGIWPRITGNNGETVIIKLGGSMTPDGDPTYQSFTYTIGTDRKADMIVSYPYLAVRFESGTAYQWRLSSYDLLDVIKAGQF